MVSAPLASAAGKERVRLWLRLLRATRLIEAEMRERLKAEFDTTLPRFDVMAALDRQPDGMMMSELSRFLLVSNGNVTGIVDRLVSDGLVARTARDGDRRAFIVKLTEAGAIQFKAMAAAHERWIDARPARPARTQEPADIRLVCRAARYVPRACLRR
jgi:DNA-binding MarR family transcriptional regulator